MSWNAFDLESASNISSYLGKRWEGIKLELGKKNRAQHSPSLEVTQETVVEYEFEVSEDVTVHWIMTIISGREA